MKNFEQEATEVTEKERSQLKGTDGICLLNSSVTSVASCSKILQFAFLVLGAFVVRLVFLLSLVTHGRMNRFCLIFARSLTVRNLP
jgi:hypothetical protein